MRTAASLVQRQETDSKLATSGATPYERFLHAQLLELQAAVKAEAAQVPNIQDLLDALARKPESQCYVQQLREAVVNIQVSARRIGMSKISFVSNQLSPSEFMSNTGKVGFIVWVARDRLS